MRWFKKSPQRYTYRFSPQADISAMEVACCLQLVVNALNHWGITELYDTMPPQVQRHFIREAV